MNEDRKPKDDALQERAAELFTDSVENLDAATRSRLNQARQKAMQAARPRPLLGSWQTWVPAGAAAAVATVAIVMWNGAEQADVLVPPAMASDFEILMDQDELEMLEDLEFYSWLDLDNGGMPQDENVG